MQPPSADGVSVFFVVGFDSVLSWETCVFFVVLFVLICLSTATFLFHKLLVHYFHVVLLKKFSQILFVLFFYRLSGPQKK